MTSVITDPALALLKQAGLAGFLTSVATLVEEGAIDKAHATELRAWAKRTAPLLGKAHAPKPGEQAAWRARVARATTRRRKRAAVEQAREPSVGEQLTEVIEEITEIYEALTELAARESTKPETRTALLGALAKARRARLGRRSNPNPRTSA